MTLGRIVDNRKQVTNYYYNTEENIIKFIWKVLNGFWKWNLQLQQVMKLLAAVDVSYVQYSSANSKEVSFSMDQDILRKEMCYLPKKKKKKERKELCLIRFKTLGIFFLSYITLTVYLYFSSSI